MNRLNVQSELLTELSDEQQEIVSGGISFDDVIKTDFDFSKQSLAFGANATSGAMGSNVTQVVAAENIDVYTSAAKNFSIDFDPKSYGY